MALMKIGHPSRPAHSPDNMKDAGLAIYWRFMFVKLLAGMIRVSDLRRWFRLRLSRVGGRRRRWLITGSKHGCYEDHDWSHRFEQLIRGIRDQAAPIGRICFLATRLSPQGLGGKSRKKNSRGAASVGRTNYTIDRRNCWPLNVWASESGHELPQGAKVVGASDFCAKCALLY